MLGGCYQFGNNGFPVDCTKAIELYKHASELGSAAAHYNLGKLYRLGKGVDQDMNKAIHHYQIAAMMGNEQARYSVARMDWDNGKHVRAMRHFMIAAKSGCSESLEAVKLGFQVDFVMKEDLETTLRCYQASQDEMKSEERDRAKAAGIQGGNKKTIEG